MSEQLSPSKTVGVRRIIGAVIVGIAFVVVGFWFFEPGVVSTNDAQLDGHIHPLNARVAGTIIWVDPVVDDTHFVKAGTVLARLDRNDYEPTVNRLQGDVQSTEAQLVVAQLNVGISEATAESRLSAAKAAVDEAEAEKGNVESQTKAASEALAFATALFRRADDDRRRYEPLVGSHTISRSEYDQRATEAATAAAQMNAAAANLTGARQRVASAVQRIAERTQDLRAATTAPQQIGSAKANVQRVNGDLKKTRAALRDAALNLGYTKILAPVDGVIGRKQIEVGQRITVGQLLLTLSPRNDVWAIANFKETQLRDVRIGQPATIHLDSNGKDYKGIVESVGGATGSRYSLIPPDNATGNFVKVVQRVPVRIRIDQRDEEVPLLPGMSAIVAVRTRK